MATDARPDKTAAGDWRYAALLDVMDLVGLHTDLDSMLPDLARCLGKVVEFDGLGFIVPMDPEAPSDFHLVRAHGVDRAGVVRATRLPPIHETPLAPLWTTPAPTVIRDLDTDPRYPELSATMRAQGIRSVCFLRLTTELRPVGIMGFVSVTPGTYDHADLSFLQRVASLVAVAIDNAQHHQRASDYQRRLETDRDHLRTLLEINNAVAATLDLHRLLAVVTPNLRRMVPHDATNMTLIDEATGRATVHAMDPPLPEALTAMAMSTPAEQTPFYKALTLRQPIVVGPEAVEFIPEPLKSHPAIRQIQSVCFLPLFTPRRVLGALTLGSKETGAFASDDLVRLSHVAGQISIALENALAFQEIATLKDRLAEENLYLEDEIRGHQGFGEIIGESRALQRVLAQVRSVAATDTAVLLLGETGTGKELVARAIHELSLRKSRALVTVNCATSPAGLLESEWFGHEKGAFTGALAQKTGRFELANQGTLFLDEIGDVPLDLQAKLLRVLQEHEIERLGSTRTLRVDFRLIAATNRNLEEMVASREYRSDLYYRLNVFPIRIPPLRERPEDIPPLVQHFTQRYARRLRRKIDSVPREAMDALCRWHWPGNVRELQNVIERAVILSQGPLLQIQLAEFQAPAGAASGTPAGAGAAGLTLEAAEREHILRALTETGWVIGGPRGAAERLGVKRTTLVSTMRRLGIVRPKQ